MTPVSEPVFILLFVAYCFLARFLTMVICDWRWTPHVFWAAIAALVVADFVCHFRGGVFLRFMAHLVGKP